MLTFLNNSKDLICEQRYFIYIQAILYHGSFHKNTSIKFILKSNTIARTTAEYELISPTTIKNQVDMRISKRQNV